MTAKKNPEGKKPPPPEGATVSVYDERGDLLVSGVVGPWPSDLGFTVIVEHAAPGVAPEPQVPDEYWPTARPLKGWEGVRDVPALIRGKAERRKVRVVPTVLVAWSDRSRPPGWRMVGYGTNFSGVTWARTPVKRTKNPRGRFQDYKDHTGKKRYVVYGDGRSARRFKTRAALLKRYKRSGTVRNIRGVVPPIAPLYVGEPELKGLYGPVFDGVDEDGYPVLRYDTAEVAEVLTGLTLTKKASRKKRKKQRKKNPRSTIAKYIKGL